MNILLWRTQGWQIIVCLVVSLMPWMGIISVAATVPVAKPAARHAPHHQALITRKVVFKNAHINFHAEFPQLIGSSPAVQRANREIRQVIYTSLASERTDSEGPDTDSSHWHEHVEWSYGSLVRTNRMLGLAFDESINREPLGRPDSLGQSLNLDLATGKRIKLSELFTPGTPYLAILGTASRPLVIKQLKEIGLDERDLDERGLGEPLPADFDNWLITPDGLSLIFCPGYMPSLVNIGLDITIPWNSLPHLRRAWINTLLKK